MYRVWSLLQCLPDGDPLHLCGEGEGGCDNDKLYHVRRVYPKLPGGSGVADDFGGSSAVYLFQRKIYETVLPEKEG